MKNLNWILHAISLIAILFLFFQNRQLNKCCKAPELSSTENKINTSSEIGDLAFFYSDSLLSNLKFFKENENNFKKKQEAMTTELRNKEQNLQNELRKLQENAPNLTRKEAEAAQEKLARMEQELMNRKDKLSEQFAEETAEFNEKLHQKVTSYLDEINKEKKYRFVFSVAREGNIFYADKAQDITQQMIQALNDKYSK